MVSLVFRKLIFMLLLCVRYTTASAKAIAMYFFGLSDFAFVPSFVRPFARTDLVTTISHERLEQSR